MLWEANQPLALSVLGIIVQCINFIVLGVS